MDKENPVAEENSSQSEISNKSQINDLSTPLETNDDDKSSVVNKNVLNLDQPFLMFGNSLSLENTTDGKSANFEFGCTSTPTDLDTTLLRDDNNKPLTKRDSNFVNFISADANDAYSSVEQDTLTIDRNGKSDPANNEGITCTEIVKEISKQSNIQEVKDASNSQEHSYDGNSGSNTFQNIFSPVGDSIHDWQNDNFKIDKSNVIDIAKSDSEYSSLRVGTLTDNNSVNTNVVAEDCSFTTSEKSNEVERSGVKPIQGQSMEYSPKEHLFVDRKRAVYLNDSKNINKQLSSKKISIVKPIYDKKKNKVPKHTVEIIKDELTGTTLSLTIEDDGDSEEDDEESSIFREKTEVGIYTNINETSRDFITHSDMSDAQNSNEWDVPFINVPVSDDDLSFTDSDKLGAQCNNISGGKAEPTNNRFDLSKNLSIPVDKGISETNNAEPSVSLQNESRKGNVQAKEKCLTESTDSGVKPNTSADSTPVSFDPFDSIDIDSTILSNDTICTSENVVNNTHMFSASTVENNVSKKDVNQTDSTELNVDEGDEDSNSFTSIVRSAIERNTKFLEQMSSNLIEPVNDEENTFTVNDSAEEDVICLTDDDDEVRARPKKPLAAMKCVNPSCMSGEGLYKPSMFTLSYFGLKRTRNQLVCEECYNMVVEHYEKLAAMLKEGKPLFSADFPNHKDIILIDSDEDSVSDDESCLSDGTLEMIQDNLDDVIAETLTKYDLDHQIRESCHILDTKIETLEEDAKKLDKSFDQVQQTLDEFRRQIYNEFTPPIEEIDELHIEDCEIPPMPIFRNKHQNKMYYKGLANTIREKEVREGHEKQQQPLQSPSRTIATKKVTLISQLPSNPGHMFQEEVAVHSETRSSPPPNLPPSGPLRRPKLRVGDLVYTMKSNFFSIWILARIIEIIPKIPTENDVSTEAYRVRYENCKKPPFVKTVTGRYLAYNKPASTILPVGTRVIAIFKEEEEQPSDRENYYVGVIAEPAKSTNKYRYLVFFDDGYTQYCPHDNIFVVCNNNKNVWEDIHPEPREFIRNYLNQYPERAMVKLNKGQVVKVEWNGRWWIVRVLEVDASLVKVHFDADRRTEWIYRGSARLGPMFNELAAAKERQTGSLLRSRGFGGASNHKNDLPYVEYTRGDNEDRKSDAIDKVEEVQPPPVVPARSVARKSTAKKPQEPPPISNPTYSPPLVSEVPRGVVTERKIKPLYKPLKFRRHLCGPSCVEWTQYTVAAGRPYDPLVKPLMFGFQRIKMAYQPRKIALAYRTPCGRMVRSHEETLKYLQTTKSSLTIDFFDFDYWVNPLNNFKEGNTFGRIEDLSYGKEPVPISCVNELDHKMPLYVQYMTARQPAKDVNLNLDTEFLVGCDCTDDCQDREKCSCWQLTMQGKPYVVEGDNDPLFGYQYRRLPDRIATGIYECNSRCKCKATCLNRVAQQPLSYRLQLFKTLNKGWGIRCLHDIPSGSFICIYAGFLLTETEANEGGKEYGDEYLAELDYIESVEGLKEGYESEAMEMSDEDELISEQQSRNGLRSSQMKEDIRLRLRRRPADDSDKESAKRSNKDDDSSSSVSDEDNNTDFYYTVTPFSDKARKPQTFNVSITRNDEYKSKYVSVRKLYDKNEEVYIMDAKTHGNIGRYLNHSCSPNVFVQNVFVDTHDLRFPWVAFFANQHIGAGTELTWDYNYDVGSVPDKSMLCYCNTASCRGRLL